LGSAGTAVQTYVWTTWEVDNNKVTDHLNNAAWLQDSNDPSLSLETGIFTGLSKNGIFYSGLSAFYTLNDGNNEYDYPQDSLTSGSFITFYAYYNTNGLSYAAVGSYHLASGLQYPMPMQYNFNFVQSEVYNVNDLIDQGGTEYHLTMSGGSDTYWGYWLPQGEGPDHFKPWSFTTPCVDDPGVYFNDQVSNNEWNSGGGWPYS
jgi:hypothetical protein